MNGWASGLALTRSKRFPEAIESFDAVVPLVFEDYVTHQERCRFLLDYGNALFSYMLDERSPEIREKANTAYQMAADLSERAGDFGTNARCHLMIAKTLASAELYERAKGVVEAAEISAARTQDAALQSRIYEFKRYIESRA